ncbi:MAG: metallophosphoesterase family protein [Acidimicrobiia bacterium]
MRFLHTGDWHVGRQLRGRSRSVEHEEVLAEIVGVAAERDVDAVLVVGDLFDTAAPTPEAERIVFKALLDLADTGAHVIVLAGNHDSDRRLQAVGPVLARGHITTRASFVPAGDGGVVRVRSKDGTEEMLVACLPFLSQRYVVRAAELMGQDAGTSSLHYAARMGMLIDALSQEFTAATVNVVAAHCMVDGAKVAGSERSAHTIFEYAVSSTAFPISAHYVALGHLHRQQRIPGPCPIHYAGSPLQLDFGEVDDIKAVLIVEASRGVPARVATVPLKHGRHLEVLRATMEDLATVASERGPALARSYLKVVVEGRWRAGLADDVRALFPTAVDVVVDSAEVAGPVGASRSRLGAGRPRRELFAEYLAEAGVEDRRLERLFDELLEETEGPGQ